MYNKCKKIYFFFSEIVSVYITFNDNFSNVPTDNSTRKLSTHKCIRAHTAQRDDVAQKKATTAR